MALGDAYQLKLHSTFSGQECLNVFYYASSGSGDGNCADLNDAFIAHVLGAIAATLSDLLSFTLVESFNIDTVGDFAETAVAVSGARGGDAMPPFVATGFKFLRADRTIRNGAKRFAGVSEADSDDGITRVAGYVTTSNAAAVAMENILTGALDSSTPILFHKTNPPGTPLAGSAHVLNGVVWERFTSQNTRKIGRGS